MSRLSRFSLVLMMLALSLSGWVGNGCGGGGGGGGGPTQPPTVNPPSDISFSPASSPVSNSIYLSSGGGAGSTFILEVEAQNVSDLYSVSFILNYPDDYLTFSRGSESEGTFLSANGEFDTSVEASERTTGEVAVGITRLGEVPGVNGSGSLLTIEFRRQAAGSGPLQMVDPAALDSFGVEQVEVTWIGGSVTVR